MVRAPRVAVALALAFMTSACAVKEPEKPVDPDALPVVEVMAHVVQPAADQVWGSAGYIINMTGEHPLRPRTDAEWKKVEDGAVAIAEAGYLLQRPGRPRDPEKAWDRWAEQLTEVGLETKRAVEDQASEERLTELGDKLYQVCTGCHEEFTSQPVRSSGPRPLPGAAAHTSQPGGH